MPKDQKIEIKKLSRCCNAQTYYLYNNLKESYTVCKKCKKICKQKTLKFIYQQNDRKNI